MSLILLAAAYYRITLSEQNAWLALAEASMWLVLLLFLILCGHKQRELPLT